MSDTILCVSPWRHGKEDIKHTVGSDLSGLHLSRNLIYSTRSVGNEKCRVLLYSNNAWFIQTSFIRIWHWRMRDKQYFSCMYCPLSGKASIVMEEKPAAAKRPRTSVTVTVKKNICTYKCHHPKATQEEIKAFTLKDDGLDMGVPLLATSFDRQRSDSKRRTVVQRRRVKLSWKLCGFGSETSTLDT